MDYGFAHHDRVFTPNGTTGLSTADVDARNAELERAELAYWARVPDVAIGYYKFPAHGTEPTPRQYRRTFDLPLRDAVVTTWPGTVIGRIVSGRVYGHNFGGRFVVLTMLGTNGSLYFGRASWDGGSIIRLRKARGAR
jgi:hypothetical protein